jgi:hypothetical protein
VPGVAGMRGILTREAPRLSIAKPAPMLGRFWRVVLFLDGKLESRLWPGPGIA